MMASDAVTAPVAPRGRTTNLTLWVVQVLFAAFFAFAGLNKLFGLQQEVISQFAKIGAGQWFRYLTGSFELIGAIGLLIPRLSGMAAVWLACVMAGAIITHLLVLPPVALALVPATLGAVLLLIAWGRWPQTKAFVGTLVHG